MKENNKANEPHTNPPLSFDGPRAASDHHKIIFENDRVRVVDFRVSPGDTVPVHTHRWAAVNYVIGVSDFRSFDGDGNLILDSRNMKISQTEGSVFYQPAFPPLHSVENIGSEEIRGVTVELNDQCETCTSR